MINTKDLVEFLKFDTLILNNYLFNLGQRKKNWSKQSSCLILFPIQSENLNPISIWISWIHHDLTKIN